MGIEMNFWLQSNGQIYFCLVYMADMNCISPNIMFFPRVNKGLPLPVLRKTAGL
jgi:hypothetical protein